MISSVVSHFVKYACMYGAEMQVILLLRGCPEACCSEEYSVTTACTAQQGTFAFIVDDLSISLFSHC